MDRSFLSTKNMCQFAFAGLFLAQEQEDLLHVSHGNPLTWDLLGHDVIYFEE